MRPTLNTHTYARTHMHTDTHTEAVRKCELGGCYIQPYSHRCLSEVAAQVVRVTRISHGKLRHKAREIKDGNSGSQHYYWFLLPCWSQVGVCE